jgi:hypothetical protein
MKVFLVLGIIGATLEFLETNSNYTISVTLSRKYGFTGLAANW